MSATEERQSATPEMVPVEVAFRAEDGTLQRATAYGEPTANPYLVITPVSHNGKLTGSFSLTHTISGLALQSWHEPGKLREIASRLAHLDWGQVTRENFPGSDRAAEAKKVIRELRFTDPSAVELPMHDAWGPRGKGEGLARAALPLAKQSLADLQLALNKTNGEDAVPFDVPDPDNPEGTRPNPEWTFWITRMVHNFGLAYLLLTLRALDPETADSAAAFLADAWDAGDSTGEWAWEWHQALLKGETPHLPGVPQLGELFSKDDDR